MKATLKSGRPPSAIFHAITVVWGREYLAFFLDRCIPNQLGDGNLAALPPGSRYRIMTRATHVAEIQAHPAVQALGQVMAVDVVAVPELDAVDRPDPARRGDPRYELMTVCHRQAIGDALRSGAALIFLAPDIIVSVGTFAAVVRQHRAGFRAVVCTGLRLEKDEFLQSLDGQDDAAGALAPRDLVRVALPHLHEQMRSMFLDSTAFSTFPVAVYWRVGADGLLARSFHLHPLMLDPTSAKAMPKGTVDGDYLARACPDPALVHVVVDSDEFVLFELTRADRPVHPCGKDVPAERRQALVDTGRVRSTGAGVAIWRATSVAARCDDFQLRFWQDFTIRIHGGDLDPRWATAEATATAFVSAVMRRCRPFGIKSRRWFKWLERWRQRQDRYRQAWRRRVPRIRLKQVLRPVRLAPARVSKRLRKATRQWRRQAGVLR